MDRTPAPLPPGGRRSALVIRNPAARRSPPPGALDAAAAPLRARGWRVTVVDSAAPGDVATLAARAAAAGVGVVAACGGDGTLHEAAGALAGTEAALTAVPAGTANVWAHEAGIPIDPTAALDLIPRARRVRVDLGVADLPGAVAAGDGRDEGNEGDEGDGAVQADGHRRPFLLMCSFGLDAEVVRRVGSGGAGKARLGRAWYAAVGGWTALRWAPPPLTLRVEDADGGVHEHSGRVRLGVAGNTRLYGGVSRLASGARIDDGLLDLVTFEAAGPLGTARQLGRGLRGGLHRRAGGSIGYRRARRVEVHPSGPLPVQLDGEYAGTASPGAPLRLTVLPGALTVLMAPRPTPLLGER